MQGASHEFFSDQEATGRPPPGERSPVRPSLPLTASGRLLNSSGPLGLLSQVRMGARVRDKQQTSYNAEAVYSVATDGWTDGQTAGQELRSTPEHCTDRAVCFQGE